MLLAARLLIVWVVVYCVNKIISHRVPAFFVLIFLNSSTVLFGLTSVPSSSTVFRFDFCAAVFHHQVRHPSSTPVPPKFVIRHRRRRYHLRRSKFTVRHHRCRQLLHLRRCVTVCLVAIRMSHRSVRLSVSLLWISAVDTPFRLGPPGRFGH